MLPPQFFLLKQEMPLVGFHGWSLLPDYLGCPHDSYLQLPPMTNPLIIRPPLLLTPTAPTTTTTLIDYHHCDSHYHCYCYLLLLLLPCLHSSRTFLHGSFLSLSNQPLSPPAIHYPRLPTQPTQEYALQLRNKFVPAEAWKEIPSTVRVEWNNEQMEEDFHSRFHRLGVDQLPLQMVKQRKRRPFRFNLMVAGMSDGVEWCGHG